MTAGRRALIVVAVLFAGLLGLPGVGAVPEAAAQIAVTAADPPTGEQGALNLNVLIKGRGFKNGAKAAFFKTRTTDPAGVNVKSTQFVSSTQLIATIAIADAAALALFDIQVANADGRTGKGTELFSVIAKRIDPCTLPDPVPSPGGDISYYAGNPGFLDANFGNGTGRVIGLRAFKAGGGAALQQVDGESRIVIAGSITDPCSNAPEVWAVARFLSTGAADESFGAHGVVTTPFPGPHARVVDIAVDGAGRPVAIGVAQPKTGADVVATVVRYNPDGSIDASFGTNGVVRLPYGNKLPYSQVGSVAVQSDNKILISGLSTPTTGLDYYLEVFRLNVNGTLDSTFNGSGHYVYKDQPNSRGVIATQWVGSEERLVVSGQASKTGAWRDFKGTVWRLTAAGVLDASFGVGGVATANFEGEPLGLGRIAVDGPGLVVAGSVSSVDDIDYSYLALFRFNERGEPDLGFGQGGAVLMPSPTATSGGRVAIQADGRILVAGKQNSGDVGYAAIWRFETTGLPDVTFGRGGVATNPITDQSRGAYTNGLLLQADGTVVTAGGVYVGEKYIPYPFLARFWQ